MSELPERLRAAADAHHPDRERMLARVERGMDPPGAGARPGRAERSPAPWGRVVAVTAAVAGAIGLGGLAVGAAGGAGGTGGADTPGWTVTTSGDATVTPPPAVSGTSGSAAAHPRAGSTGTSLPPTGLPPHSPHSPSAAVTTPAGHATGTGSGYAPGASGAGSAAPPPSAGSGTGMTATGKVDSGSNAYWTQSDITVTVSSPLTSLTVELRVAAGGGVASTGQWSTMSAQDLTASTSTEGGYLVYRWVLDAGRTVQPGTYTFAGQFQHDPGNRDASGDHYGVTADGPGGPVAAGGGF
ncbi:hypothetical protein [Streptomyces sp. HPF1205]|uniref:hypothetical protein n=1 Tax=Streptomyces sp. HPF1205 TaxID=2873262 RepID=UPI001CED3C18|nr:hypothetical protein [Streptomyces sp. HPF1205]